MRKLSRPEKEKTLAIPLSRQWAIKPSAAVHVLAWLTLGDGSDAADVSTGNRFPFGGVESSGNTKQLHHFHFVLVPLSFSSVFLLLLLLLLLHHDTVDKVRHHLLRLLVFLLNGLSPVPLSRLVGGRRPVVAPPVGAVGRGGRARMAGAATVGGTRTGSLAARSVTVTVTVVLVSSSFSISVTGSVTVTVTVAVVAIGHGGRRGVEVQVMVR